MTPALPADTPALVIVKEGQVELRDMPTPTLGPGELLLEVLYSGVSVGTEMLAARGKWEGFGAPPFVTGYQAVGRVLEKAKDVEKDIQVGDFVACFKKGSHRKYMTASAAMSHRVSGRNLEASGIFVQPSVGANALNHAEIKAGESVLVIGQGLIGQTTAMQAQMRGAFVVGADISEARLALARQHCIDVGINSATTDLVAEVAKLFPDGVDVVIESTGIVALVDVGLKCVKTFGRFVFEGFYPGNLSMTYTEAHTRQIKGVFPWAIGGPEVRESVLRSITSGRLDLSPLISHSVQWTEAAGEYQKLLDGTADDINGMVINWGSE